MKYDKLIIVGAGGHGRVVHDIAVRSGYSDVCFLDDKDSSEVIGKIAEYSKYINCADFVVAIGNSAVRERIQNELLLSGAEIATLIHPNAVVGTNVKIGKGSVVMAGTVVNPGAVIGDGVIINTSSSVDHDCKISDFCHISVGAHLAGTVHIGTHTMVGAGATVINNISICERCVIGAGAVVVKDINDIGVYIGVPAKKCH